MKLGDMDNIMNNRQPTFIDRITRSLALFGLGQMLGIPAVGAIASLFFKGVGATAYVAGDAIATYSNADEAYEMMQYQMERGAQVREIRETPNGIEIDYDTSGYTCDDISADALDMLGEWF